MKCPNCNQIIPDDSEFCQYCGYELKLVCPKCGADLDDDSDFCKKCGKKINKKSINKKKTTPKKIKITAKEIYDEAVLLESKNNIKSLKNAIEKFSSIPNYEDSEEHKSNCLLAIKTLKAKKRKRIILSLAGAATVALIVFAVFAAINWIAPEIKYKQAVSLANEGKYDESNKIFNEIIDYKNSKQLIHTHNYNEIIEEVKPLCEKDGYVIKKCECGETNKEIIKMTGHNYSQTIKKEDATCEEDGLIVKKCACGKTKEEVIHKLGHSYTSPTCTESGKCSRCGKAGQSALGHMTNYAVCPACGEVLFEKQTYSGYGKKAITGINLPEGEYNIISTFSGEYNFIVKFENELIANQIGSSNIAYKYITPLNGLKNGILNVEMADGNWSIAIEAVN